MDEGKAEVAGSDEVFGESTYLAPSGVGETALVDKSRQNFECEGYLSPDEKHEAGEANDPAGVVQMFENEWVGFVAHGGASRRWRASWAMGTLKGL